MSLTQALSTALSGLSADADQPVAGGGQRRQCADARLCAQGRHAHRKFGSVRPAATVQVSAINRVLDQFVQTQLRTESAGAAYADVRANLYSQLQDVYGTPGPSSTLESAFNTFTNALQALSTSPDDPTAQIRGNQRRAATTPNSSTARRTASSRCASSRSWRCRTTSARPTIACSRSPSSTNSSRPPARIPRRRRSKTSATITSLSSRS